MTTLDLSGFTGSETHYRHALARSILYTEGARYVAETAGAYWLLDEIALAQLRPEIKAEEFQTWKLDVKGSRAELVVGDGDGGVVWRKEISFTDFPEPGVELWCENSVIYLPSEH